MNEHWGEVNKVGASAQESVLTLKYQPGGNLSSLYSLKSEPLLIFGALTSARSIETPLKDQTSSLPTSDMCTLGPNYWCQNSMTARLCNKYEHCVQTVWPQQVFSTNKKTTCELCKGILTMIKTFLQSQTSQEMVQDIMGKGCYFLPNQIFTLQCVALSKIVPLAMNFVGVVVDPKMTCFLFCIGDDPQQSINEFQVNVAPYEENQLKYGD